MAIKARASANKRFTVGRFFSSWPGRVVMILGGLLVAFSLYVAYTLKDMPDPGKQDVLANTITVYDRHGSEIETRNSKGQYHRLLNLGQMGRYGPAATLAAEDRNFYSEGAVNLVSTGRALLTDIAHRGYAQGGSTITQQLVKIQLLTPQKSIFRKIQEVVLAEGVASRYSKDQVLEMYLNRVYYGHNAYGLGAAAKIYFGKDNPSDLSAAEGAFLAGLIQAPVAYDPQTHFDLARQRQVYVLDGMVATGALTRQDAVAAKAEDVKAELKFDPIARQSKAPHFVDYVLQRLERDFGAAAIQQGGFSIYTTLDLDLQQLADDSVKKGVADLKNTGVNNGMFLAAKPDTGEILVWVGSADYYNDAIGGQYDVINSPRQPGSSFKPYVYEAALKDHRLTVGSYLHDVSTDFGGGYRPHDFDDRYMGDLTMRRALVLSRNIPAVEAAKIEGIDNVNNLARGMGINSELKPVLSTAIGSSDVTMYDHVQAWEVFANQGNKVPLVSITKIVDSQGGVLSQTTPGQQDGRAQILTQAEAFLMTDILKDYQKQWNLGWNRQMASKTGTTGGGSGTQTRDAWIMAYNPNIVAGAWVGNTAAGGGGGGITTYGELVGDTIMRSFVNGLPQTYRDWYQRPSGIVDAKGCDGKPEIFLAGTEKLGCSGANPSPSPSPSASPSPSPSVSPSPTPIVPTPSVLPSTLPSPSPKPSPTPTTSPAAKP